MVNLKWKRWEVALLCGLLCTVALGAVPIRAQNRLADKLTRLHVVANSDSDQDQRLKLQVRDAVLRAAQAEQPALDSGQIDEQFLEAIRRAGQQEVLRQGYDYPVRAERARMYFDTRYYEDFSLPAGYYDAVRVTIGSGQGKNWWCVMLPPLCDPACSGQFEETAREAGLEPGEIRFMTRDGIEYAAKFKVAELWGQLVHKVKG